MWRRRAASASRLSRTAVRLERSVFILVWPRKPNRSSRISKPGVCECGGRKLNWGEVRVARGGGGRGGGVSLRLG